MTNIRSAILITPLIVVALVGCAPAPELPAVHEVPPLSSAEEDALTQAVLDQYADQLRAQYPGIELPEVERIRFTQPQEFAVVFAECLSEAGFPASVTDDNGISFEPSPPEQAEAQSIALYTCRVQYPTEPSYLRTFTAEQFEYLHAYSQQVLIPCLESNDIQAEPLPSLQSFSEQWGTTSAWDPYAHAIELSPDALTALLEECPVIPDEFWG